MLRALAISGKSLGPDHPDTAAHLSSLAELYRVQGLYAKAEPLLLRALAIREKALGPDHTDTANSLNNLASLYDSQGLHAKAEPLYQRALNIYQATQLNPPAIPAIISNLMRLYQSTGETEKIEALKAWRQSIKK